MLIAILCVAALYLVLERLIPGTQQPEVRGWRSRAFAINLAQLCVVLLAGLTWERWLSSWSLLTLPPALGSVAAGLVAYFISTFVFYWWHRIHHQYQRHEANDSDIVWWTCCSARTRSASGRRRCGFDDAREQRLVEMLAFRDVHGDVCRANPMIASRPGQRGRDQWQSNQFQLLRERRFAPFFGMQFLGALNDNVFKHALVILLAYQAASFTRDVDATCCRTSPRRCSSCRSSCSPPRPASSPTSTRSRG